MNAQKILLRIGQIALIVLVTWGIVRALAPDLAKVSIDDFAKYPPSIAPLLLSTALLLVFYLLHAELWRSITQRLGESPLSFRPAIHIYFISGLGRYIPGKLWQVAGMALLAQRAGISAVAATGAAIVAQLFFVTSGLIYLALVLPSWGGMMPVVMVAVAGLIAYTVLLARHEVARRVKRLQPVVDMMDRLEPADAVKWWLGYASSWIILGIAFVLFTSAFISLNLHQQRYVAGAVSAAYLGGLLAFFSIAGLGVREALMGSLLATVMPAPAALVVSVGSRIWFTVGELLPIVLGHARSSHHTNV